MWAWCGPVATQNLTPKRSLAIKALFPRGILSAQSRRLAFRFVFAHLPRSLHVCFWLEEQWPKGSQCRDSVNFPSKLQRQVYFGPLFGHPLHALGLLRLWIGISLSVCFIGDK